MPSSININCDEDPQLQEIAKSIPAHHYKINPLSADQSAFNLGIEVGTILKKEANLASHKIVRHPQISPDIQIDYSLIAIAATYLKEKKGLKNLYVCTTEKALAESLTKIKNTPGDVRAAFVLSADFDNEEDDEISHVLTICVEKIGSTLKIFWLDSLGGGYDDDHEDHFNRYTDFREVELYFLDVKRLTSDRECMTFALRDAALFLENPQFFNQIKFHRADFPGKTHNLYHMTHLPPSMMKGTQSLTTLKTYLETYTGDTQNLQQSLAKHTFPADQNGSKKRNYYIVERSMKYHHIALLAIKNLSADQLQRIIAKSLLIEEQKASSVQA